MLYLPKDIEKYFEAKEYIDTLIIPLLPITISKNEEAILNGATQNYMLTIFSNEIEKQFTGRCLLTPTYTYNSNGMWNNEKERLMEWIKSFKGQPFKHIFFLSFDHKWKLVEKELDGYLIWLPSIPIKELEENAFKKMIQSQVKDVTDFLKNVWNG